MPRDKASPGLGIDNPVDDPEKAPRRNDLPSHLERKTAIETESVSRAGETTIPPQPALPNNGVAVDAPPAADKKTDGK